MTGSNIKLRLLEFNLQPELEHFNIYFINQYVWRLNLKDKNTDLGIITAYKVLHFQNAVIDAESVSFLNCIVSSAFLSTWWHCLRTAGQSVYRHFIVVNNLDRNVSCCQGNRVPVDRRMNHWLAHRGRHRCWDCHNAGAGFRLHQLWLDEQLQDRITSSIINIQRHMFVHIWCSYLINFTNLSIYHLCPRFTNSLMQVW